MPGTSSHYMQDPLHTEAELVAALKLTAGPPRAWIEAAGMIPSTLGDLAEIEQAVANAQFRERFVRDPSAAVTQAGLTPSEQLIEALRVRLAQV